MKTIEEAINDISNQILSGINKDSYTKDEIGDMFDKILLYVHSLPLSERLTAEEREKMVNLYRESDKCHKSCSNSICNNQTVALDNEYKRGINMGVMLALKHIFGKSMFAEEGGTHD